VTVIEQLSAEPLPAAVGTTLILPALLDAIERGLDADHNGRSAIHPLRVVQAAVNRLTAEPLGSPEAPALPEVFSRVISAVLSNLKYLTHNLREHKFGLAYQPTVGLADGEVFHFEALWRFPDGESPAELIKLAEQVGVIEELDYTVCSTVIDDINLNFGYGGTAPVAINISGRSITNPIFADLLMDMVCGRKTLSRHIHFEITETFPINDLDQANAIIQSVRSLGFKVGLDGVGGATPFQTLTALEVDFVKIAGSVTARAGNSPRDLAILRGLVDMCHQLGAKTVGGRVETAEQVRSLRACGVQFGQGWYYGRPTAEPTRPNVGAIRAGASAGAQTLRSASLVKTA